MFSGTAYGVDGCKRGWLFFALEPSGEAHWNIVANIGELVAIANDSDRIFIDIPIGLPDGEEERLCDKEARKKLESPRGSSVFRVPVRAALRAENCEDAKRINRKISGKSLTNQTLSIMPKIREVDELLRTCAKARRIVREVHPEVCFWALAGKRPMKYRKKERLGIKERIGELKSIRSSADKEFDEICKQFPRKEVAKDDIVDAMAAALTASADSDVLCTLPAQPEKDSRGLTMEMVYAIRSADPSKAAKPI